MSIIQHVHLLCSNQYYPKLAKAKKMERKQLCLYLFVSKCRTCGMKIQRLTSNTLISLSEKETNELLILKCGTIPLMINKVGSLNKMGQTITLEFFFLICLMRIQFWKHIEVNLEFCLIFLAWK